MLKRIKDCRGVKRGWRLVGKNPDEIILENPDYGRVEVVANCFDGPDKARNHDQIVYVEPSGSVVVVLVDEPRNKIYLHVEKRPAMPKSGEGARIAKGKLFIPFEELGRDSMETVRGYGEGDWNETALKEIREETGYAVEEKDLQRLGVISKDTASAAYYLTVVLARCDSNKSHSILSGEEARKISNGKWYTVREVQDMIRGNEIRCALTLAALNLYFQNKTQ